jgi:ABC-type Zn uptake system ZnuABC Zn-binding protein ZnuA
VEPKPGIPPSAKHVHDLIELMKDQKVQVVMAPSYFAPSEPQAIAERTGAKALIVPLGPGSTGPNAYFDLIGGWVSQLAQAYKS